MTELEKAKSLLARAQAFVEICIENAEEHTETSGEPTDLHEEIEAFLTPSVTYKSVTESRNRPSKRYA